MLHYQAAIRYKTACKVQEIANEVEEELEKKRHYWIYGPANCGKSTWRKTNIKDDAYEMPLNNDWCNYEG